MSREPVIVSELPCRRKAVVGCGSRPQWPAVATIANREGVAPSTPVLRPAGDPEFSVVESIPPHQAWRVPALEELLPLTS